MQTPYKLFLGSLDELVHRIKNHVDQYYRRDAKGDWVCKNCNAAILAIQADITLHFQEKEGCVGPGRVGGVLTPFCPNCEVEPEKYGCIHLPKDVIQPVQFRIMGFHGDIGRFPPGF